MLTRFYFHALLVSLVVLDVKKKKKKKWTEEGVCLFLVSVADLIGQDMNFDTFFKKINKIKIHRNSLLMEATERGSEFFSNTPFN